MSQESNQTNIFHCVGVAVAASQLFETIFILTARFALKQPDLQVFKDIEKTAFKQPIKALLKELTGDGKISDELDVRIQSLMDKRHTIIHRAFLECGWPIKLAESKEKVFLDLCLNVIAESQVLSIKLIQILLPWMEKFPETEGVSTKYKERFYELSKLVNNQSNQLLQSNESA